MRSNGTHGVPAVETLRRIKEGRKQGFSNKMKLFLQAGINVIGQTIRGSGVIEGEKRNRDFGMTHIVVRGIQRVMDNGKLVERSTLNKAMVNKALNQKITPVVRKFMEGAKMKRGVEATSAKEFINKSGLGISASEVRVEVTSNSNDGRERVRNVGGEIFDGRNKSRRNMG